MKDKSSLRKHYLELMKKQGGEDRTRKSQVIGQQLFGLESVQKARTILFYASLPGEVETFAMIQKAIESGKRVALPIIESNQRKLIPTLISSMEEIHSGTLGILQPSYEASRALRPQDLDAVIVPGLCFDKANNRLGRGAGYYDRFLKTLPSTTHTVGLAFDFQLIDCLPVEGHDVPLHQVIAN